MSTRDEYPAGVPCWVETLQPQVEAALDFYGPLFEWEFDGPLNMPGDADGQYFVGQARGLDIAGICSRGATMLGRPATWTTYVRVDCVRGAVEKAQKAGGTLRVGPFGAPYAGRQAVLADPAGAEFGVWEGGLREGAQLVNEPPAWVINELCTTDVEGSKAFYGALFGWQADPFGPPEAQMTLWRLPGYVGGESWQIVPRDVVAFMTPIGQDATHRPRWGVEFSVADVDAVAERAAILGGTISMPPFDTPRFRNAVLVDPRGAEFAISARRLSR